MVLRARGKTSLVQLNECQTPFKALHAGKGDAETPGVKLVREGTEILLLGQNLDGE